MTDAPFEPVSDLLDLLDLREVEPVTVTVHPAQDDHPAELAPTAARVFVGSSQKQRYQRIFGGQLLAQGIIAAARTVTPADPNPAGGGRPIHSLHTAFLASGSDTADVHYVVEPLGDGRSFSTRRILAVQDGRLLATLTASFQDASPGLEHHDPMPTVPAPERLKDVAAALDGIPGPYAVVCILEGPIELRHVEGNLYAGPGPEQTPDQSVWLRSRRRLPDDPTIHAAFLAYSTDYSILEPVLRAHGVSWAEPRLRQASLDHAIWFHRAARADEWVLHAGHSPSASGGRGLGIGSLYAVDGRLVATVAQEGMLRLKG